MRRFKHSVRTCFSGTRRLAAVGCLVFGCTTSWAQFTYSEDFKGATASGWVLGSANSSPFSPILTAASGLDSVGSGWLRMTDLQANEATYARLTTAIPSSNNNITVALDLAMWNQGTSGAADGMTISLRDASVAFTPGAFGGSLGYANRTGVDGMAGGYFSLGIDNFGNFSSPTEGRNGGIGFVPNSISTRGPGSGQTGYNYLGGTSDLSGAPYSLGQLDFPNSTLRPAQGGVDYRQLVFNLDSSSQLTVSLKFGASGPLTQVYTADLSGFARPENLELVYTGSTGASQQINEIRNLVVTTTAAPVGNIYYSNYANDNKWGTGTNWGNATTPNLGSVPGPTANLIFSNNAFTSPAFQLTTAQNVDLQQNRTAASLQFDAPFNYTLQGYQLTLDNGSNSAAITVTSAQPGGAHTLQSNLQLNSNLNINTNTNTALVLAGSVSAGTKTFTLNNNGTTTFAGPITGSGTMTQSNTSTGTIIIAGNSATTYTGNIDIQRGTLQLGGSNVLSAATNLSLSNPITGIGTFNLANYNQTLGSLTYTSGGAVTTGSGTLTLGGDVTSLASATEATMTGNLNLGSATRTFNVAPGAAANDLNISASISGTGAGINKTGTGTLLLSGNNSFNGANTITAGTVIAANDNALGTAAGSTTTTVSSGATLGLQGGITVSSAEAITLSGTGDTGRSGVLDNLAGNNAVGGAITLAANSTLGAASGTTLTVAGAIGETGSARTLTANGAGTIVLSSNNTYTGATTVNSGTTLVAASNNALGTSAAGTTVTSGGTLGFQGGINYTTTEALTVSGTGAPGRNGAIDNLSGNNTFAGSVTLAANTTVGAASGSALTLSGAIGESGGTRGLTAAGAGTVVLSGNNTYGGTTTINSGTTLVAAANNALGNTGAATATTVTNGGSLAVQGGITIANENITINGTGAGGLGSLINNSGNNAISNAVTLGASSTVAATSGNLTLNNGLAGGAQNLTKIGAGTLTIAGASTYTGTTAINEGTLSLAGNGALASSAGAITVSNGTLILDNTGTNNSNRISATPTLTLNDGNIRFLGNATANSSESLGTVTANNGNSTFFLDAGTLVQSDVTIANLTRIGSATVTFTTDPAVLLGAGLTSAGVADSPRVFLSKVAGSTPGGSLGSPGALPGWILVNDLAGSSNFAEYTGAAGTGNGVRAVQTYYTGPLGINIDSSTANVLLSSASPLAAYTLTNNLGGNTTDGNLKITDAPLVDLNTNASSTLRLNNGGLLKSGATATTISGAGRLTGPNNGTLAVTVDNAAGSLTISSAIIDRSTTSLTKAGPGVLELFGANSFTGAVNINEGTLRINSETGLGNTTATKTVTFNGGTLNVTGSFIANAAKTWTIGSNNSGTLDINSAQTLSLTTAGALTTGNASSQLIKNGAGSLVLSAANTGFTGTTLLNAGSLQLGNASALGNTSTAITLAGGALDLRNNSATTFNNKIVVTADSTISVDRATTTGSNLTHTLGSLTMGANTLNVTGGNNFDLTFGATTLAGAATINTATAGSDVALGAVSGSGSLTKTGAATLTLTGANTYGGNTSVGAGTLFIANSSATLPATTNLSLTSGATFDQNSFNQSVASLAGGGNVTLGTGTLTTGSGNSDTAYSGSIGGAGGLTKTGTGNLTMQGANTFTGAANIDQGTLTYSASNVLNDGVAVAVAAPGTLNLAGFSDTIGSLAGAGAVQLGSGTLTTGGNNNTTVVSGVISGPGGNLVKQGTGTMTLSASNTFTGTTTVSKGTLSINTSSALGGGDGTAGTGTTVAAGATLQVSGAVNVVNEALLLSGTGTSSNGALQNVSGSNSFGGPITLGAPATISVNSGTLTLGGTLANGGNTLTVNSTGNTVANGAVTGTGGLTKTGVGALVFSNTGNTYSGATALTGGTIQIGANDAGPASSALTLSTGTTLDVNSKTATVASLAGGAGSSVILGTGSLSTGANNNNTSFAGVISGTGGSFSKDGSGTLTISGANNYTGATNINAGTLSAGASTVISNQSAVTVANGAAFTLNNTTQAVGSIAGAGTVNIGSGQFVAGANHSSTTFSGAMTGTGGTFTKDGAGTLTLSGVNTYTGSTTIAAGTLALGASNALSTSTSLTISSGAALAVNSGVTDTIAGLTTTATSTIALGSNAVLTVNRATASTLLGSLSGSGTLAYTGGGNLTLANNLNFASGSLAFGGTTTGGTPTSTLFFGSTTTIGTLHLTGDTILDFGNSTASVLNTTNFILDPGVKISITNWVHLQDYFYATSSFAGLNPAQFDTRGGTPENQITFSGYSNNATAWQSWDRQITPAPEPATYGAMMIAGALSLLGYRRWKKNRPVVT